MFGSISLWSKCAQILTYNGVYSTVSVVSVTVVPSKTLYQKETNKMLQNLPFFIGKGRSCMQFLTPCPNLML